MRFKKSVTLQFIVSQGRSLHRRFGRDLVHLTLTEAALRAHKANLARALVAERAAMKPASRLNRRLLWRLA